MDISIVVAMDMPCCLPVLSLNLFSGVEDGAVTR